MGLDEGAAGPVAFAVARGRAVADWAARLKAGDDALGGQLTKVVDVEAVVDTLRFISGSGNAVNAFGSPHSSIAVKGATVEEVGFRRFDETMNSGDLQHTLSVGEVDGEVMTIGFEDHTGGGNRAYEDVALRGKLVNEFAIAL